MNSTQDTQGPSTNDGGYFVATALSDSADGAAAPQLRRLRSSEAKARPSMSGKRAEVRINKNAIGPRSAMDAVRGATNGKKG